MKNSGKLGFVLAIGAILTIAAAAYCQIFYSENITPTSSSAIGTLGRFQAASRVRIRAAAANTVYVRFSRDYLADGDFEDSVRNETNPSVAVANPQLSAGFIDAWDSSSNLLTWGWTENTVTIEPETINELYGYSSLRFDSDAVTQLILNNDLEDVTGDNFASWTENVNAGTGTITSEETDVYDAAESAELTGGSAHVDFTSANTTVTASTNYVFSVWGDVAAAGDLLDIRIREATGGTDYLQSNGTWAAGEADFCNATFDEGTAATFTQCLIEFTTDPGITALTVSANVDVSGDIGRVDAFTLHVKDNTVNIQTTAQFQLCDTTASNYMLQFSTAVPASRLSARVEYAIINPGTAAPLVPRYWTGSAWSATETWISATYPGVTASITRQYFQADTSDCHTVQVRIRPETLGDGEDLYLDKVFLIEAARAGQGILQGIEPTELQMAFSGRFSAIATSSTVVNIAAIQ